MKTMARGLIIAIGLLAFWHIVVIIWQIPSFILPGPLSVAVALYQQSCILAQHALPTFLETVLGFLFGIAFGCLTGFLIAFFRPLNRWFLPVLIISQAIPTFAIAPLLVIWLGYGLASKIATTILMIFFPVASAFYDGLQQTEPGWLDLAKTMNAKKWRIFWHIRIPAALPTLASGIRIAAVVAPIGAIVGEWVGSSQGLGYLMLNANARLQIDVMFAALVVIILLALILYFCIDKWLRTVVWWSGV